MENCRENERKWGKAGILGDGKIQACAKKIRD